MLEVFGRYAGFTAMLPTMAGAAHRCVIPEYKFNIEHLTELLVSDRAKIPAATPSSWFPKAPCSKAAKWSSKAKAADAYGHKKLGGIGDLVAKEIKERSAKFNNGKKIDVINQKLGYLVRSGDPDAIDSIVPMAYGNLALDLLLSKNFGKLVVLKNGRYDNIPIADIAGSKKWSTSMTSTTPNAFAPTTTTLPTSLSSSWARNTRILDFWHPAPACRRQARRAICFSRRRPTAFFCPDISGRRVAFLLAARSTPYPPPLYCIPLFSFPLIPFTIDSSLPGLGVQASRLRASGSLFHYSLRTLLRARTGGALCQTQRNIFSDSSRTAASPSANFSASRPIPPSS